MIESVEGRKEGYESDVDEGNKTTEKNAETNGIMRSRDVINLFIFINIFIKNNILVELMDESVEKDESASDEESSKDGDFNLPNYAR